LQSHYAEVVTPEPPDPSTFPHWAYEARPYFHFEILHESKKSLARVGRIHTPHGIIDTPSYVAVATNGAIKGAKWQSRNH
jgi:queuine tRNA-ribosyltransferase